MSVMSTVRFFSSHRSKHLQSLHWYGQPIHKAVSWRGMLSIVSQHLFRTVLGNFESDSVAANYGINRLYYAEPKFDGITESAPTVWHCTTLQATPWHDARGPVVQTLEQHSAEIANEFVEVRRLMQENPDNPTLIDSGYWGGLFFYSTTGELNPTLAETCPITLRVIESLPLCKRFGFAAFSQLAPGSHVQPHCGSTNLRLRVHLGINVPEPKKAKLRVGTKWRGWQAGKCIAFDDSFEHEVVHEGKKNRTVLITDIWHPELTDEEIDILSHPVFSRFGRC